MRAVAIRKSHEVESRLDLLGLNLQLLRDAVEWAYKFNVAEVTDNEPPISRGITMYLKLTRALREGLLPLGWKKESSNNYSTTIHPDGSIAIVVASGDEDTGKENGNPWTVSRKGKATKDAVDKGQLSLELDDVSIIGPINGPQIWVLLVHVDLVDEEIRIELARPRGVKIRSFITDWQERIILTPISLAQQVPIEEEVSQEIEIEIQRRSAEE